MKSEPIYHTYEITHKGIFVEIIIATSKKNIWASIKEDDEYKNMRFKDIKITKL